MNGRKAKRLRREAERLTIGAPALAYGVWRNREIRCHPASTRGVYLRLKREAR